MESVKKRQLMGWVGLYLSAFSVFVVLTMTPALAGNFDFVKQLVPIYGQLDSQESLVNSGQQETPTRYPIILAHGLFGSDVYFDLLEYFFEIPEYLRSLGYDVYVTKVPASSPVPERAVLLGQQIDNILRKTGAKKVNIIGHSMGGLDARFLVSSLKYGDRVASVTTIGTPHRGTSIADVALGRLVPALSPQMRMLFLKLISFISGYEVDEQSMLTIITQLTKDYVENVFNPQNQNDPNVYYQSYGGVSSLIGGGNDSDRVNPLFILPFMILRDKEGDNDGLVGFQSSKIPGVSEVTRISADHFAQVGQPFHVGDSKRYNHKRAFARIARDLAARGF